VSWFRRSKSSRPGTLRGGDSFDISHLEQFVLSRRGVEAYVEPRTNVTAMTIVLVAHDGEWTRRRISGPDDARRLGQRLSIPVYDVAATGYPNRMREWNRRRKEAGQA
jgi:hypothetical protein